MERIFNISNGWNYSSQNHMFKGTTDLPSCNYLDLLKDRFIGDPFFGENEEKVLWVSELAWSYEKTFSVSSDDLQSKIVRLHFDSIDTVAEIFLNNSPLATVNNVHIPYDFDIKERLSPGDNTIKVVFESPVHYVKNSYKHMKFPPNIAGINRFTTVRKAAYQFGWDWGPVLPCSGFNGGVSILFASGDLIDNIRLEQSIQDTHASLHLTMDIERYSGTSEVILQDPDGQVCASGNLLVLSTKDVLSSVECHLNIDNPKLWNANGMYKGIKKQPIYTLIIKAGDSEKSLKIGIRKIELSTIADEYGNDFCFVVNGKRIFAKGANWIPADSFPSRISESQIEWYIKAMADANYNMIRIWGGGFYASDYFMQLCDEYGILVWHDYMFACGLYPFRDEKFKNSVLHEISYNTKRLRNHPSLALLCGNNEIDAMSMGYKLYPLLLKENTAFFYETLPSLVKTLTSCAFWQTSPGSGKPLFKTNSDDIGDTHIWAVWHGMMPFTYFLKRNTRFCSEFGFESLPPVDTLMTVAPSPNDLDLNSSFLKAHQKCGSGNARMLYYIINNYRIPKKFDHLTYLSQLTQAESVAAAVDHWHRHMGRCNGSLYWQFNDCWHTASWSGIDYLGGYKALHYYAKNFYSPVSLSFLKTEDEMTIFAVNDSQDPISGNMIIRITDFDGDILLNDESKTTLQPYSSRKIESFKISKIVLNNKLNKVAFVAEFLSPENDFNCIKTSLLVKDNEAQFKKPTINIYVSEEQDDYIIHLKSDTYVRKLMLNIPAIRIPFSTNYFDMEAGREYQITISKSSNISAEEIKTNLALISYADIEPKYSRKIEKLKATQIALIPINFIGRILYKFM
jgi:beta-mannosidase